LRVQKEIFCHFGVPFPGSPQLVLSVGFEAMASPTAENMKNSIQF